MGTHPIFESDFDCLTDLKSAQMTNDPKSAFDSNSRMPKLAISNRLPYFLSLQSQNCLKVHKFDQNLDQIQYVGTVNLHHSSHHVEVLSKLSENGTLSFAVDSKGTREVNLQFMKIQLPDSGTNSTSPISPPPF